MELNKFLIRKNKIFYDPDKEDIELQLLDYISNIDEEDKEEDEEETSMGFKGKYLIKCFGITNKGESVYIKVKGFEPYFYLEAPKNWKHINTMKLYSYLMDWNTKYKNRKGEDKSIKYWTKGMKINIEKGIKFRGYQHLKKTDFIKITLKSLMGWKILTQYFAENIIEDLGNIKNYKFKLYESKLDPLLRFFHHKDISPAGWIKLKKRKYKLLENIESNCQYECEINWDDIEKIDKTDVAPLIIASFDIECTSIDGTFPQANREGDKIIQIGTTVDVFGNNNYKLNHIITLDTCDNIEGAIVESYKTEIEVLLAWQRLILKLDPDIIIGYNIFGFDFDYLYNRAKLFGIDKKFGEISRLKGYTSKIYEKKLESSAMGINILKLFPTPGRIQIDLLKYIQREYKLTSYKLDNVSKHFLQGQKKDDVSPNQIFKYQKEGPDKRKIIAEYCIQDCRLCNKLLDKLCVIVNNIGMANVCSVPFEYIFSRGQGIKIESFVSKVCRNEGYIIPTNPKLLINRYDNNIKEETENVGYKGATVLNAEAGAYFRSITCLDYASLYPSTMISHNLCISSIVEDKEYLNLPDVEYKTVEWENDNGIIEKHVFAQPMKDKDGNIIENDRGILPKILKELLATRKLVRSKIKTETDEFKKSIYNGLQLSYKIVANSIYGQLGSTVSSIAYKEIAAATTATGRQLLEFARDETLKKFEGSSIVYGDTDSIFINFKLPDGMNPMSREARIYTRDTGIAAGKFVTKQLPYPHDLEWEKNLCPFILFSKKRYVSRLYEYDVDKYILDSKGIILKRRDNCGFLKRVYRGCLDIILDGEVEKSLIFLKNSLNDILNNHTLKKYPIEDFVITKTLKSYDRYKKDKNTGKVHIAHVMLAERVKLRDPGNAFQSNDRVPYCFIEIDEKKQNILQGDRVETPEYIKDNNLKLDYLYYIEKQLEKPIIQLYELLIPNSKILFNDIKRIGKNRKNGNNVITSFFKKKK